MLLTTIPWCASILLAALLPVSAEHLAKREGAGPDDPGLSRFVSRPDLAAPLWDVKVYHKDLVSPGYWFVAPYKALDQDQADRSWVGPHIYDGMTGELIWSGSLSFEFSKGNVEDFRISNVNGEYRMTLMSQMLQEGVILDSSYQVVDKVRVDKEHGINTHEFNFIENGTRALVIQTRSDHASKEESKKVGFDGKCHCAYDGFVELDTKTWKTTFEFRSQGKISLEESSLTNGNIDNQCRGSWDFIHSNSADKDPQGDYYWSARHTDTIYKIDGKKAEVIWRMGGKFSDFPIDDEWRFSRQHNIRYRGQNSTHILLSMLDNAKGIDSQAPTHDFSRGMLLAVDEKNKKVTVERHYDHPFGEGGYAPRRGNYQVLENGNIFMGWSEQATQSEHSPDGHLIMEATFQTDWLGTYRNYKFPFVGNPIEPPVAVSQAYATPNNATVTTVHISWNGATEITSWNLYRTVANGQIDVLVATTEKYGFETVISYGGFASYIIAEALDKHGDVLGRTSIVKTFAHENVTQEAKAEEDHWLEEMQTAKSDMYYKAKGILGNPFAAFLVGVFASGIVLLLGWRMRDRGVLGRYLKGMRYDPLPNERSEAELPLRSHKEGDSDDGID